jgi:hypothetical protein
MVKHLLLERSSAAISFVAVAADRRQEVSQMKRLTIRTAMSGLIVAAVVAAASPATAAPVTPNGLCGAKNMVNENSLEAMREAMMNHTDEHGDAGMARAVALTRCS